MALDMVPMFRSGIFPAKLSENCFFSKPYAGIVSHAKQRVQAWLAKHLTDFMPDFSRQISELLFKIIYLPAKCFACETRQHCLHFAANAALTVSTSLLARLSAFRERTSHGQA
ncbi:hypothetical protein [Roseicitreum antarcticum]|uniref:hypothetical protein n=1 Tax=Roseicitreum antarcticum TaxID=564137 RepID=UPI00115F84DB|nr:hypothetical protein [Roseicitreum antarcticum]